MPQVGSKVNVNSGGGSGGSQGAITGDVTVPAGSGSRASTLVATTAVKAIIAAWSAVTSVFGRTGAVTAQKGDYNATQVPNVVVSVTQSATPAIDTDNGTIFEIYSLAQAITSLTTNLTGTPVDGQQVCVVFQDNGTARAITYGTSWINESAIAPTTTVISQYLYTYWVWNSAATAWVFDHANVAAAGGSLTNSAGHIALDVGFSGTTLTTFLTTASLAAGTWLVHVGVELELTGAANVSLDIQAALGTATATFEGQPSSGLFDTTTYAAVTLSLDFIATVTVAGTLIVEVYAGAAGSVKATTVYQGYAKATGYTAVKIG